MKRATRGSAFAILFSILSHFNNVYLLGRNEQAEIVIVVFFNALPTTHNSPLITHNLFPFLRSDHMTKGDNMADEKVLRYLVFALLFIIIRTTIGFGLDTDHERVVLTIIDILALVGVASVVYWLRRRRR